MNKAVKWILVIAGSLVALIVIAVIVLPMVIDVEKYKPQIEQQVAKATGRSFKLGGDLKPSIFPWIGVRLSDLHLGNPSGFKEKDFVVGGVFRGARQAPAPVVAQHRSQTVRGRQTGNRAGETQGRQRRLGRPGPTRGKTGSDRPKKSRHRRQPVNCPSRDCWWENLPSPTA